MNATKELYNSLNYETKVGANSFQLSFYMEDYGEYIDKGVNGIEKKYKAPFSYTTKAPPPNVFKKWSKARGIKPRDKTTGKFITHEAFGFIMSRHIFRNGQNPTNFFTKSFEQQFQKLPDDIVKAFGLDLDDFLDFTTT